MRDTLIFLVAILAVCLILAAAPIGILRRMGCGFSAALTRNQGLSSAIEPTKAEQLAYTLGVDPALSPGREKP